MNQLQEELYHYGILGMKWGVRRYQNPDGTLTEAGKKRYFYKQDRYANDFLTKAGKRLNNRQERIISNKSKKITRELSKNKEAVDLFRENMEKEIASNKKYSEIYDRQSSKKLSKDKLAGKTRSEVERIVRKTEDAVHKEHSESSEDKAYSKSREYVRKYTEDYVRKRIGKDFDKMVLNSMDSNHNVEAGRRITNTVLANMYAEAYENSRR